VRTYGRIVRFPWNKVYRAFPELDRLSDAECENYARIADERYGESRAGLIGIGTLVAVMTIAVAAACFAYMDDLMPVRTRESLWGVFAAFKFTLYLGVLPIAWLIARDIWLRRAIRRQLFDTLCPGCKYQLLGLPIDHETVQCPECGRRTALNDFAAAREIFVSAAASVNASPIPPVIRPS